MKLSRLMKSFPMEDKEWNHYGDVIMGAIASQITSLTIVYSIVYSDADQRKHQSSVIMGTMASQITNLANVYLTLYSGTDQRKYQSSASLAFVRGIHRGPVNSPHKWPVTRKMFPFDDVIMSYIVCTTAIDAGRESKAIPTVTRRNNYVIITSKRRCNVVLTLLWRYHCVLCPLRWYWLNACENSGPSTRSIPVEHQNCLKLHVATEDI